jgi:hypothetical protein
MMASLFPSLANLNPKYPFINRADPTGRMNVRHIFNVLCIKWMGEFIGLQYEIIQKINEGLNVN